MSAIDTVATYLQAAGIGTLGTNLFKGHMPDSPQDAIALFDTGGVAPYVDLPTKKPTFQVLIRNASYLAGQTKLETIRAALHQKMETNLNVTSGTYFLYIFLISEGGAIGKDANGLDLFSVNFRAETR